MSFKLKQKKEKNRLKKLIEKSDSENDENEHELSFYVNDRVKLMKEVLKIIKPKKIKSMAPDCIKDLDIEEINSMLLEELLGISNKRLRYIFNGENPGEDSSSTDPEEEKQPIDVISLDDVSDDDFVIEIDPDKTRKKRHGKVKQEQDVKKIKKEKHDKKKSKEQGPLQEENLMSVLELLELQARARAIRSQLMLEANKKSSQSVEVKIDEDSDDEEAVIMEIPKNEEIVINSSDSEDEQKRSDSHGKSEEKLKRALGETHKKKITLIRDRFTKQTSESSTNAVDDDVTTVEEVSVVEGTEDKNKSEECTNTSQLNKSDHENKEYENDGNEDKENKSDEEKHKENSDEDKEKENKRNSPELDCTMDDEVIIIMDHEEM